MTLAQYKIPIVKNKNDVPSQPGDSNHPNDSLLCAKYNNLIDDLNVKLYGVKSIDSIELTNVNGLEKTYTIYAQESEVLGTFVVTDGVLGADGRSVIDTTYNDQTGEITFTYSDNTTYTTPDVRGADGRSIVNTTYNDQIGEITFTYSDNSSYTTPDIRGGGHVIQDSGVELAQRKNLNFVGSGVVVTDSLTSDSTIVSIDQLDVSGKMDKSTYDSNNDGVVNNSDQLGGQSGSHYLSRTNHTGTQQASTISDFSAATQEATALLPVSVSSNYTLQANDNRKWINASGTITITVGTQIDYFETIIQNVGTGIITINGVTQAKGTKLNNQWDACHVYFNGSNWRAVGALSV